jgi:GNAT superfamily N-acetyltransferase
VVSVRPALEADIDGVGAVAAATGQGYEGAGGDPRYVRHLMTHGRFLVAESNGVVVGYAASRRVGDADMLCDLFVDPAHHGHGLGRALLTGVWSGAPQRQTFSSAHPAAVPLYVRAGMTPRWSLFYLFGDPRSVPVPPSVRVAEVSPEEAAEVERAITGLDRADDHRYWRSRPEGASLVVTQARRVVASAAVGGAGEEYGLSHLVADASGAAPVLAVLAGLRRRSVVRLPGEHAALPVLLAAGWRVEYVDVFMATDPALLPADRCAPHPGLA